MTRKESKCVTLYITYEGLTLPESSRTTPFQRMIALATFVYLCTCVLRAARVRARAPVVWVWVGGAVRERGQSVGV